MRSNNPGRLIRMKILLIMMTLYVSVLLGQTPESLQSGPAQLEDLSFTSTPNQTVIIIRADRVFDYTSYYPNPRLFILDVPSSHSGLEKNFVDFKTSQVDFASVSQIGEGQRPMVRIEFNLTRAIQYSLQAEGMKLRLVFNSLKSSMPESSSKKQVGGIDGTAMATEDKGIAKASGSPATSPVPAKDVNLEEDEQKIQFTLQTTGKPSFQHFELDSPHRLVVDVGEAVFKVSRQTVRINSDFIQRIRFGFGEKQQGKLVRCVFDLSQRLPYEVEALDAGLIIRFQKQRGIAKLQKLAEPRTEAVMKTETAPELATETSTPPRTEEPAQARVGEENQGNPETINLSKAEVAIAKIEAPVTTAETSGDLSSKPRNSAALSGFQELVTEVPVSPENLFSNLLSVQGNQLLDSIVMAEMQKLVMPQPVAAPQASPLIEGTLSPAQVDPKDKQPEVVLLNSDLKVAAPLPPTEVVVPPVAQVQEERTNSSPILANEVSTHAGSEAVTSYSNQDAPVFDLIAPVSEEGLQAATQASSSETTPEAKVDVTRTTPIVAESTLPSRDEEKNEFRSATSNSGSNPESALSTSAYVEAPIPSEPGGVGLKSNVTKQESKSAPQQVALAHTPPAPMLSIRPAPVSSDQPKVKSAVASQSPASVNPTAEHVASASSGTGAAATTLMPALQTSVAPATVTVVPTATVAPVPATTQVAAAQGVSAQIAPPSSVTVSPAPTPVVVPAPQSQSANSQVISQASIPTAPKFSGELISLELKDADIKDFFRLIGEISGLNIVLDPDVKGALTIFLNDVPWDQALDVVLRNNSLGKQLEGNILRIASNATLQVEEEQRKRLADARVLAAELQTETRVLSYAKAAEMSLVLKKILSPRGDIIVDTRTNSMIIQDIPAKFQAIDVLIKQLDKKIKQVEIEARVITATRDFLRDVGVQFGAIYGNYEKNTLAGAVPGNPFTRTPKPSVTVSAGQSGGATNALPLISNLGANAPTSALSFFAGITDRFLLDVIITAAERRGSAKLLSKPRIITQDNIEGFVQQGVKIPVQTTINNTVSVQFFDFSLKLTVTPQITDEGTIILKVDVENSTPDFSRQVQGVPTVNTQQTKTTVLVTNGGTVVIGGVMIDSEQTNIRQVPGIGSLPLIGNLFKNRSVTKQTQELIFFLTPKIL